MVDRIEWIDQKDMLFKEGRYKVHIARAKLGMNEDEDFLYQFAIFDTHKKFHEAIHISIQPAMNRDDLRESIKITINKHIKK